MARDLAGLADVVVLTVKTAMAPVLERLALVERENADLKDRLSVLTELRDRLVSVEVKSAMPVALPAVDRDIDMGRALDRIAALESKVADTRTDGHSTYGEVLARLAVVESEVTSLTDVELLIRKSIEPVSVTIAEARERLVAVETRAPIPGPAGRDGADGKDGAPGRDGADGLGFEDLDVEFDGDRTLTLKFARGPIKKDWPIKLPYQFYQGVYVEGKSYEQGDTVTWAGSTWHANKSTTTKPGDGAKDWTLIVKRGRDGKDGKDADGPAPVVRRP